MTQTFDHDADLALADDANRRLLADLGAAADVEGRADAGNPTLLPGWTTGHLLSHLSRNADALVNLATWARTGERHPMYASAEARDADIEAGADRTYAEQVREVVETADRLRALLGLLTSEQWDTDVEWRTSWFPAARIPLARLLEVEVHHVDLGWDYTFADVPAPTLEKIVTDAVGMWPDDAGIAVHATDADLAWRGPARVNVSGDLADVTGWVTGRVPAAASGLAVTGADAVPDAPAWR